MTPDGDLAELLSFYGIDQTELDLLAEVRPEIEEHADELVQEFYRHLLQYPATQNLLRHDDVRERLLSKQREYLLSLTDDRIDEEYVKRRAAIGTAHERVGLDTRWYLGAYSLYFRLMLPVVCEAGRRRPELEEERLAAALAKRLLLDAELSIRQYVDRRESDLRHLNRELTRASQALREEVGQTSRDLRATEARAHAAERLASVGTLVSGLAHEIGTPMGVLRGHAEALEASVDGDRARWRLQMILEQIDRITTIIQSLLNIARPRESLRVPVLLDEIVETCVAFLAEKLKRRGVKAATLIASEVRVLGDPEKLQQVFLNLLINAIDAMGEGGRLTVELQAPADGEAVVRIEDDGSGIPPDDMERIFDPFFTTKEAGRGSGLGLVVVKGIIEEHGGRIEAESEVDRGTRFIVTLPSGDSPALS